MGQLASLPTKLPERTAYDSKEDAYSRDLRKQFLIPDDEVYLNNGAVGSQLLAGILKRGAMSWSSPDPTMRCGIATVNVPPFALLDLETWLWKEKKIRIRGTDPHKLRLSTPYYISQQEIDSFLDSFDEYRKKKTVA